MHLFMCQSAIKQISAKPSEKAAGPPELFMERMAIKVSALSPVAEADLKFPTLQCFVWMSAFLCATEILQSLPFFLI